jgi:hypothetical protein
MPVQYRQPLWLIRHYQTIYLSRYWGLDHVDPLLAPLYLLSLPLAAQARVS